jgi:hypothetical protein
MQTGALQRSGFWSFGLGPEVPFRKDVAGIAFQIPLEMLGLFDRLERDIQFEPPRFEPGRIRAFPGVMIRHPLTEIGSMANVTLLGMAQALHDVRAEHGPPSIARDPGHEKSSFAKPMEDILRLERS